MRHHLAVPASTVEDVASDLVGLHSSDPATVFLSARARLSPISPADLETALYERRSLLRTHGMRRTLFVAPLDLAAVIDAACTKALVPAQTRRLARLVEEQGIAPDGEAWFDDVGRRTRNAIAHLGEATAAELRDVVPELGLKLAYGEGTVGMSTRIFFLLATRGEIVRARPRGSWLSSQYRWALMSAWTAGGLDAREREESRVELVTRWLRSYGPGTLTDLKWWTGWGVRDTGQALEAAGAVEVDLDGGPGYALASDLEPTGPVAPWVALLPGLDSTVMGWKDRDWFLGGHARRLFDRNGNAGPTIWCDGRIVGGWAQAKDGRVVLEFLEDPGAEAKARAHDEARGLRDWLGETRVTPRFRTPLEKELSSPAR